MPTKVTAPPVVATLDPQDPIPESNWGYRRLFLFLGLIWLLGIKTFEATHDTPNLWTDFLILAIIVVYTIAPSAEQATKMFQIAGVLKAGVNLATAATATTPDGTTTTTAASATSAAAPAAPAEPVQPVPPTPEADLDLGPRPGDSDVPQSSSR